MPEPTLSDIQAQLDRIESLLLSKHKGKRAVAPRKVLYYTGVRLTADEHSKLCNELGDFKTQDFIQWFDRTKAERGYIYASDYMAMKRWGIEAWRKHEQGKAPTFPKGKDNQATQDANDAERRWREEQDGADMG